MTESEGKFRQLFESMSEGCAFHRVVYNDDGDPVDYIINNVNPAYEVIVGLKEKDVIGRKPIRFMVLMNRPTSIFMPK